ncbi:MAG: hypothetical protein HFI75_14320 [Lachnospiraceae bacterium]|nr:hypothetical protein [Lachnospiraceae bacterium]
MAEITLNFNMYPLVVGQFDKFTFSGWKEEGGSIQLKAELKDTDYTLDDLSWTSSNPEVASVEQGFVHAMTVGVTDICAKLPDGSCAECRIQVIDNIGRVTPLNVSLNTDRLVLGKLEGAELHPVFWPIDYFDNGMLDQTLTWTSSNPQVVLVDHRGRLFGKECGSAVITGVSNDIGKVATCQVTVIPMKEKERYLLPLEDMDGGTVSLKVQEKQKLILPAEVLEQPVNWCSENGSIVQVNESGTITAYKPGSVKIWATFINGGYRVGYNVEVREQPQHLVTEIHLNQYQANIAAGEQTNIYAAVFPATLLEKQLSWQSSDETVLKIVRQHINLSGLDEVIVEGIQEGTAVIRGNLEGKEVQCQVQVSQKHKQVCSIGLPLELSMEPGQVTQLRPAADHFRLFWLSDDHRVVTVDRDGMLKCYENGEAHIYAFAADSLKDEDKKMLLDLSGLEQIREYPEEEKKLQNLLEHCLYAKCVVQSTEDGTYLSNLHIPKESITDTSVCLLWNRKSLIDAKDLQHYEIYHNSRKIAETKRISYTITKLNANEEHTFEVAAINQYGQELKRQTITAKTKSKPETILDVTKEPYCAVGDGIVIDTHAIQRAIDDCPVDSVVLLPKGYIFHSGALFLKSHMTLQVDGILLGSQDPEDYPPIVCRWEGYRKMRLTEENQNRTTPVFEENVYSHSSLINAGVYDEGQAGELSPVHTEDLRICGSGMINANGFQLSYNQGPCWYTHRKGLPCPQSPKRDQNIRGRVIAIYNARHVYVSDLTVAYGPAWTIHPVFSEELTFDNLKVISMGNGRTGATEGMLTLNGDGIDPDSCTKVNIMGCYFTVGDDAVAIKSGRNRQGNELAKPSAYIRVTDCTCVDAKGSFCIGSEQAGGAHDILFQNLYVENLLNFGLWIKSAPCRGGLVEHILFRDCLLKDTGGAMQIEYNHGGNEDPSLVLPEVRYITYENIHIQGRNKFGIRIIGVPDSPIHDVLLRGFFYKNFEAYKERKFVLSDCRNIRFQDAELPEGYQWEQE